MRRMRKSSMTTIRTLESIVIPSSSTIPILVSIQPRKLWKTNLARITLIPIVLVIWRSRAWLRPWRQLLPLPPPLLQRRRRRRVHTIIHFSSILRLPRSTIIIIILSWRSKRTILDHPRKSWFTVVDSICLPHLDVCAEIRCTYIYCVCVCGSCWSRVVMILSGCWRQKELFFPLLPWFFLFFSFAVIHFLFCPEENKLEWILVCYLLLLYVFFQKLDWTKANPKQGL